MTQEYFSHPQDGKGAKNKPGPKRPGAWGGGNGELAREPGDGGMSVPRGEERRKRKTEGEWTGITQKGRKRWSQSFETGERRGVLKSRHVHCTQTCRSHPKWQSDKLEAWLEVTGALLALNGSVSPAQQATGSSSEVSQMPELSALCWGPPVFTPGSQLSPVGRYPQLLRAASFHVMPGILRSPQKPSGVLRGGLTAPLVLNQCVSLLPYLCVSFFLRFCLLLTKSLPAIDF